MKRTMVLLLAAGMAVSVAAHAKSDNSQKKDKSKDSTTQTSDYSGQTPEQEVQASTAVTPASGLTPGFWKQEQHEYAWNESYTQSTSYNAVFGVNDTRYDGNLTLHQAVSAGGGGNGAEALGRHAVAALLNATNPYVDYPYTVSQIISMVQTAYATGNYEEPKNLFDTANNGGGEIPKP